MTSEVDIDYMAMEVETFFLFALLQIASELLFGKMVSEMKVCTKQRYVFFFLNRKELH